VAIRKCLTIQCELHVSRPDSNRAVRKLTNLGPFARCITFMRVIAMNISPGSPNASGANRRSDVDQVLNPIAEHPEEVRGLGTGAIAAPMAVSFREEKLALQAERPAGLVRSEELLSPVARKDRE